MSTQKVEITNRLGQKLVIKVDATEKANQLVFIAHGQGGFMEQPHIEAFKRAFLANDFRVVRFDATNALGESDGDMMDVTYDSYIHDLEDVIEWARTRQWFMQPFALCGHSMGAQSTTWYAQHHPSEVLLLAPMAPPINYELLSNTEDKDELRAWERTGYRVLESRSKPGVIKQVGWGVVKSLKKYDLLELANELTVPVLNIVGSEDKPCPAKHQELFMAKVASKNKKLVIIDGLEHSYRNASTNSIDGGLSEVEATLTKWIRNGN